MKIEASIETAAFFGFTGEKDKLYLRYIVGEK
jgi:hypothetical protein